MSFTVTIIRHGQTDFNVKHLIHTSSDDTINDTGRAQADTLGKFLSEEKYTRVYSSDLKRCLDTAQGILCNLKHSAPAVIQDKRLRERDFAEWDGRPMTYIFKVAKEQNIKLKEVTAPGGETYDEAATRIINFFEDLFTLCDGVEDGEENILICSHGLTIQSLLQHFNSNPDQFDMENFAFEALAFSGNTARTKFIVYKSVPGQPRKVKFHCLHDQAHLPESLNMLPKIPIPTSSK